MNSIFALGSDNLMNFIVALLMLVVVIVLCYYTTRFVANYQKGVEGKGNIEILEAKNLGNNKMLEIVKVGEECYLLGVSKDNITLISKVDESTLNYEKVEPQKFRDSFNNVLEKIKKNRNMKDK